MRTKTCVTHSIFKQIRYLPKGVKVEPMSVSQDLSGQDHYP